MSNGYLSVIMPVYNEKDTIREIVDKVLALNVLKELIIVDDSSDDGTRDILRSMGSRGNVTVLLHDKNMGKGAAICTGREKVTGEIVAIQDADLEYDPKELEELTRPIREGVADAVYGSRLWGGKPQRVHMFWHLMGNRFLTLVTDILFNATLTDMETCYKVMRADVFRQMRLKSRDFCIEPEITAKILKKKLRVYEMPISYYGRTYEEGKKITWRHGITALWSLLRYRFTD
ncbi:MAG: glycosyltransferase family 2 protein [Candidatus Omnitrophota bacterium]